VEYAGGYVYEGNQGTITDLQYFDQEQGYVKPVSVGSTTFQYVYQYRDHLGNNRLAYTDSDPGTGVTLTKIEENNYDAFGLKHQGYNNVISSAGNSRAQALKYNGKELQNDFGLDWYDYGARFYDAALGRWLVMDPLAEKRNWLSPYNYCQGNPILRIDPNGALDGEYVTENGKKIGNDGKNDENIHVVTNKKDIKTIKENEKNGNSTDLSKVNVELTTTKTELSESINVLERTKKNGGFREETSVVTPEGVVTRGTSGEKTDGNLASAKLPYVEGQNNTSIHSHPTGETVTGGFNAIIPGPQDPSTFKGYRQNIIVGPLGPPTLDAYGNTLPRSNGAVFFDRNTIKLGILTEKSINRILKN
jgi:RHS repeat-associated protein